MLSMKSVGEFQKSRAKEIRMNQIMKKEKAERMKIRILEER